MNLNIATRPKIQIRKYIKYYHNDEQERVNMTEIRKYNKYYHNDKHERVNMTEIGHCQFFGHVHQFRSYKFSHLDLVK